MKFYVKSILALLMASVGLQSAPCCGMDYATNFVTDHKNIALAVASAAALTGTYFVAKKIHEHTIHPWWTQTDPTRTCGKPMAIPEFFKHEVQKISQLQEPQRADAPQNLWLWGSATSDHQVSGNNTNNDWHDYEGQKLDGRTVEPAGIASDSLNHIDEDVEKMAAFGLNAYRFSIEWSKVFISPTEIGWEYVAKIKYLLAKLKEKNIKACVTIYHYTQPKWFAAMGSFEREENIQYFVDFAKFLFEQFGNDVYMWYTFNAPEGVAAQGWLTGTKPPAKKDMRLMARVLYHILEAQVRVYQTIKAMPGGQHSRIGILKNIMQLDPWRFGHPADHICAYFGTELVDNCVYRFLTTGEFYINIPKGVKTIRIFGIPIPTGIDWVIEPRVNQYIKNGGKCADFIGLNYYCHNYIKGTKTFREPNPEIEIPANNERYTIYGEGLYRALKTVSKELAQPLNVPIYVTENGIGTDNDEHRILQSQRYLRALAQARLEGVDVRGYIHWSWVDNYEWGRFDKHYGLHALEPVTLNRVEKPGAAYYKEVVQRSKIKV